MARIYQVHHARGSLWARQQAANKAGCACYAEEHVNAHTDQSINYAMAICDANASQESKDWASTYTRIVAEEFGVPDRGVLVYGGRGSYNVRFMRCPSILLEPGFISNPEFSDRVRTGEGIDALAYCLVQSIRLCFPDPSKGPVGLSAGHAYRGKPDPGAPAYDKGDANVDPDFDSETEVNCSIIDAAGAMLESGYERKDASSDSYETHETEPSGPPTERS